MDRDVVVDDRQHRDVVRPERGATGGVREEEEHRLVTLGQEVAENRNVHDQLGRARREVHDLADRRVIQARRRGAVRRGEADGDHTVGEAQTPDRDANGAGRFADGERVRREVNRRVVVDDREDRRGLRAEHGRAGRQAQCEVHRLVTLDQRVVDDRDVEGLDRLGRVEGQRAEDARVIEARARRAVTGREVHAHDRVAVAAADDRDNRRRASLAHAVGVGREVEADVVVEDRQHRVGLRADEGRAHEAAEVEVHRLGRLDERVVDDGDIERRLRDTRREGERAVGRDVIEARRRGAIAGREIHGHEIVRRAGAQDRDERVARILDDRVTGRAELHRAVVIDNGDDRVGETRQRAAGEVEEAQVHRLISLGDEVVDDRHVEGLRDHVRAERERARDAGVIGLRRQRGAVGRLVLHRDRAGDAVGARDRDGHTAGVFVDEIIVRAEAEVTGAEVIIQNRQHRVDQRSEIRGARRCREVEENGFVTLDQHVVENRDRHREAVRTGEEHEVRHERNVIRARRRRAARQRRKRHRIGRRLRAGAHHHDGRRARVLRDIEAAGAEVELRVVIHNRQCRRGLRAQRGIGEIEQTEQHRAVHVRQRVIRHRHREGLHRRAGREDQRAVHRRVIHAAGRRTIPRRVIRADLARLATRARDRDRRHTAAFAYREVRRAELQRARARAIRAAINADHAVGDRAIELRETTRENDLVIERLNRDRRDEVVRAQAEVDRVINRAIRIDADHTILGTAVVIHEAARHDDLAIRLNRHREHRVIRAHAGIEREVQRAVGLEAREPAAGRSAHIQEVAADDEETVGLNRNRRDRRIRTRAR